MPAAPVLGAPVYTLAAMFPGISPLAIELDAISSGNDHIPFLLTVGGFGGCLDPNQYGGTSGWVAMTFSVKNNQNPQLPPLNAPGIINSRVTAYGAAAVQGDLYGYFLPTSDTSTGSPSAPNLVGVPDMLPGQVYLEQGREHMNLPTGFNLDGHDAYMPYIQAGATIPPGGSHPLLYTTTKFYFSLTPASAIALAGYSSSFGGSPHPATIYSITWKPTGWTGISVFRTAAELGLSAGDIDALAVRNHPSRGDAILYSTGTSGPVLYVQGTRGSPIWEARDRNGVPIRFIVSGDIDSISVYDPEFMTVNQNLGFPFADTTLTQPSFSLCVTSEARQDAARNRCAMSVSGLRPTDSGTMQVWRRSGYQLDLIDWFPVSGSTPLVQRLLPADGDPWLTQQDLFIWLTLNSGGAKYSWPVRILR